MFERRLSSHSNSPRSGTPTRIKQEPSDDPSSPNSPGISRYGRSHKPKMQDDFVSTDKKVSAYLKLSPGNQLQNYSNKREYKKKNSPKKNNSDGEGTPRRGRPPKFPKNLSTENANVVKANVEPQDPSSTVEGCEYMVGDLAWGRVGGHPFWPCIIALDPVHNIFTKNIRKGRTSVAQRWVHVQFFGDNGRRSWLNISSVMSYNGREAFIQLGDTILAGMRKKEPKQTAAFVIKPAVIQVWEKAVQEAEDLLNASREERVGFFSKYLPPPNLQLIKEEILEKLESTESPPSPKKRGRKRKIVHTPSEEESKKKQPKLESTDAKEEMKVDKGERVDPLSTTPRTIADRKKRQALLMQMARNSQSPVATPSPDSSSPVTPAAKQEVQTPTSTKQAPLKRSIAAEATESVEKKKPKKKYAKKKKDSADFQVFTSKHFDRVADEHPELNEKEINKYLFKMWNEMDDSQKSRYKARLTSQDKEESESTGEVSDDVVGSVEDVDDVASSNSSKSSSPSPLAVPSQKSITVKRNNFKNLFSGAKAEKVCLLCEKAGETVRCRGPCHGFYHPSCVTNPPPHPDLPTGTKRVYKKIRKRNHKNWEEYVKAYTDSNSPTSKQDENEKKAVKDEDSQLAKETEKEQAKENGMSEVEENVETKSPEPETEVVVVEPKTRKGSKDSDSGSSEEGEGFRCKLCQEGRSQPCFVCQEYVDKKTGEAKLYRCVTSYCGKVYHEECLKGWPQSSWRTNGNSKSSERGNMTCPQHTCHTCASDNPGVIKARFSNDKLVRCIRCPVTYHYGSFCLPAGCEILTNSQIICPQHSKTSKKILNHVNAAWCFICASGGSLICCDLCPTAFHADCLNISTPPDGSYVCEDCQTGRFPLYGEIVWVKLGSYRWWPAEILYPAMIPDNILNLPHARGDFAVKFFGSNDYYWVNRGRVFLHQDGDSTGKTAYKKSSMDQAFERAVKEANDAQRKYLEEKATRDAEARPGMKVPNYVKLKTNKPVGNVRTVEMNLSSLTPCECDPKKDNPCAPDSDCLNRILMVECHPQVCPAGEKCCNQLFEKRLYPPLQPFNSQTRGWGLKTLVPLKKGDFVIEYVGEIINEEEYKKRLNQMHVNNEENFYFLTIDKDRMLDAGPKGNVARFMNHSCQPNCETQKWTVNGDTRVGLFALHDIPADTELVFNYNLESIGDKKPCMCGAPNCSGFIGVKVTKNQEKEEAKEKKIVKKKKSLVVNKAHEEDCFVCGQGGELLLCDGKHCTKGYHMTCLNKKQRPQGYWLCPWHQCNVCNKGRVQRCSYCVNSYCQEHSEGNIRLDQNKGLVCSKHDPENPVPNENEQADEKLAKLVTSTLPEPTPMEVDIDSSEISPASDSDKLKVSVPQQEHINNNVVKSSTTPLRRTRRSQSNTDPVVNGSAGKASKRIGRPSSVDDNLITSLEKTETNNSKQVENSCNPSSKKDVKALLDQVIDTLPTMDALETIIENQETKSKDQALDTISTDETLNTNLDEQGVETISNDEVPVSNSEDQALDKGIIKDQVLETNEENQALETTIKDPVLETKSEDQGLEKDIGAETIHTDQVLEKDSEDQMLVETINKVEVHEANENQAPETIIKDLETKSKDDDEDLKKELTDPVFISNSEDKAPETISKDLKTKSKDDITDLKEELIDNSCEINSSSVVSSEINSKDNGSGSIECVEEGKLSEEVTSLGKSSNEVLNRIDNSENSSEEKDMNYSDESNSHRKYTEANKLSEEELINESDQHSNMEHKSPTVENKESTGTFEAPVVRNDDKENQTTGKEPKTDDSNVKMMCENDKSSVTDIEEQNVKGNEDDIEAQTGFIEKEKTHEDVDCLNNGNGDSKTLILAVDSKENLSETENVPFEECPKTVSSNVVNIFESRCDENVAQKTEENTLDNCEPNGQKCELVSSTQVCADDDFELSYTECSIDNISKEVSNTESSIELKLTDFTTSKTEEIINKSEEIKSDLTNGIEQHSATEVA